MFHTPFRRPHLRWAKSAPSVLILLALGLPLAARAQAATESATAADIAALPDEAQSKPNPFAALRALKTGGSE